MDYEQTAKLLPPFLVPLLEEQYGAEITRTIVEGFAGGRLTTLRANALRSDIDEVRAGLDAAGIEYEPVAWYPDALVITNAREKALWSLPLYQEGKIYLQSLSSMLPPVAMKVVPGLDILDMCSAPGGKTTQMAALGGRQAHITACELNAPRAERLEYNLERQGATNVTVLREDARRLSEYFRFDQILVDAPCSGSGTIRATDVKLHRRFTEQLIAKSQRAQAALLGKALTLLKPGGTCVYSTCSVLACENEDIVSASLTSANKFGTFELMDVRAELGLPVDEDGTLQDSLGIPLLPTKLEGTICVTPTLRYEGFFMAKIKRKA
jgi:ribosomal RNA methyltransferase Nop2